jgi:hypothetical protein
MSTDNRTIINDCDANTGWSGSDTASVTTLSGLFFEGAASLSTQFSNGQENMSTTEDSVNGGTFSLDWSDSTLYMIIKDNLIADFATLGVQFVIGDATPDTIGYRVGGNDAVGMPLSLGFSTYRLDVSEVVASPGTNAVDFQTIAGSEANLTQTACTRIGYGGEHTAKAQGAIDNAFMDCFRYIANGSYALTVNGGTVGTPETMADVVTDDIASGWGMVANPLGSQYTFAAPTQWGDTGTADSYFTATSEQWYWMGDNGGGHALGANNFPFRLIGNGTGTNSWVLDGVVIVNTGTRAQFDLSDSNMDIVQLTNVTFVDLGAITMPAGVASDKFCDLSTFINCDQANLDTMYMDGCTFVGTTDANGAILWDAAGNSDNQDNLSFISDGSGHAIYITAAGTYNIDGYEFSGYAAQGGTAADRAIYNNSGGAVTINVSNGAAPSYRDGAGASTTIVANVTTTLTGLVNNTEVTVYDTGTGAEIAHVEDVTGNQFSFADTAGNDVYIYIHHIAYYRADILDFVIPSVASSIPVQQTADPNYVNN